MTGAGDLNLPTFQPSNPRSLGAVDPTEAPRVWVLPAGAVRVTGAALAAAVPARACRDAAGVLALVAQRRDVTVLAPAAWFPVLTGPGGVRPVVYAGAAWLCFPAARPVDRGWCSRLLAAVLWLAVLPWVLLAAGVIRWQDGAPAFFVQTRAGRDGRLFRLWKLRTMQPSAEEQRAALAHTVPAGRPFKVADDPRATRLGRWLRAHGLDELPQLWQVVQGTMRLVGPRPLPAYEDPHYAAPWHGARLDGWPGLTGLWQVSGRNARTFEEMCQLDIWYLRNRSLGLDLWILLRTVRVVWRG